MIRSSSRHALLVQAAAALLLFPAGTGAQEPVAWGEDLVFHTFSIAAVDPVTGESGVAVTTRVPCVGNGVPWVRAGVGAVATQASTRTEYGRELLDFLEEGLTPAEAMARATAADDGRERRQVGVVAIDGSSAQHTGTGPGFWAGHRSGPNYATQGNVLVGPEVVEAVAAEFESTEGSGRHLADRLISALAAGQAVGGDRRMGRLQSAAVIVADPREGRSRRPDGITAHVNVCEHPTPVAEVRRIYNTISGTLGFRTLQQFSGSDVWQVKLIMHALGYYRSGEETLERDDDWRFYGADAVAAVDAFRADQGLSTPSSGNSPPGLVDEQAVARMWATLEQSGDAERIRALIRDLTFVSR